MKFLLLWLRVSVSSSTEGHGTGPSTFRESGVPSSFSVLRWLRETRNIKRPFILRNPSTFIRVVPSSTFSQKTRAKLLSGKDLIVTAEVDDARRDEGDPTRDHQRYRPHSGVEGLSEETTKKKVRGWLVGTKGSFGLSFGQRDVHGWKKRKEVFTLRRQERLNYVTTYLRRTQDTPHLSLLLPISTGDRFIETFITQFVSIF